MSLPVTIILYLLVNYRCGFLNAMDKFHCIADSLYTFQFLTAAREY